MNTAWTKSSRSNGQANCVEIASAPDGFALARDSKQGEVGAVLAFTAVRWRSFIGAVKLGQFDH